MTAGGQIVTICLRQAFAWIGSVRSTPRPFDTTAIEALPPG